MSDPQENYDDEQGIDSSSSVKRVEQNQDKSLQISEEESEENVTLQIGVNYEALVK